LRGVANVFHITNFTTLNGWNGKIANRIATELEQALEEISIACANCIFLANFRQNKEGEKKINEFLKNTKLQAQKLKGNLGLSEDIIDRRDKAGSMTDRDSKSFYRNLEVISDLISNLAKQSRSLLDWLQDEAALDLGATAKGEEHQVAPRSGQFNKE
jgi:ABC-type transporter Mla subunit MlaD